MTNPKAALTWIAIMVLGLQPDAPLRVYGALVAGAAALSALVHVACALLFSTAPIVRADGPRPWSAPMTAPGAPSRRPSARSSPSPGRSC